MRADQAIMRLLAWTKKYGEYVLSTGDIARILGEPREGRRIEGTIRSLARLGFLKRACRGFYVVTDRCDGRTLEAVAAKVAGGDLALISYEQAASEWGLITQVVSGLCTCVTNGRSRSYGTPWGEVRLFHSDIAPRRLLDGAVEIPGCPLRMTSKELTIRLLQKENAEYVTLMDELGHEER